MKRDHLHSCSGAPAFTLIEIIMAMAISAFILAAVYGVFSKTVHLRSNANDRTRDGRIRSRALSMIRNDLRNALISGGALATVLTGTREAHQSSFPGYLKFTTTTGQKGGTDVTADLQQVEYYVENDPEAVGGKSGVLVRAVDHNLLAPTREIPTPEPLLSGVASLVASFYDGTSWQESWEVTPDKPGLPQAIRVTIQEASHDRLQPPAPLEVLVPWTTQAAITPTPSPTP